MGIDVPEGWSGQTCTQSQREYAGQTPNQANQVPDPKMLCRSGASRLVPRKRESHIRETWENMEGDSAESCQNTATALYPG